MRAFLSKAMVIAALLGIPAIAHAQDLSGDQIKALINGKTVHLSTPYGAELPLQYRVDGSVKGDVSGFSMASMFAPKETGKWWVKGEKLCQQWPTWYKGKALCFTIEQTGPAKINWTRDDGLKGTARIDG